MKRDRTILLLLLSVFLPLFVGAAEENPPSSTAIYQTLEQLWSSRKFTELTEYVHELRSSWDGYVPVELTLAIYSDQYGAQVEDAIDRLESLRERLGADVGAASPVFMELLDSRIIRYKKAQKFYLQQGISREQRLAERDPLKKTEFKHSKHWVGVDEMMYFNAPEVFLTEQGIIPAHPGESVTDDTGLKQKNAQQLLQSISDDQTTMDVRKAAARELVKKRATKGDLKEVAQGLDEANMVYTYRDTVEELAKVGREAVPGVLEALNAPSGSNTDKKCAIWALVRIGVADPDVIQTLQAISENADRADLAKYAQDALQYLQARNRRSR
ncbi:MAG: hypothetical protein KJ626_07575 [Verrucomicrobia bacterium]|nr:hypothetical protein [Verrucomicrobiota bacterium]